MILDRIKLYIVEVKETNKDIIITLWQSNQVQSI